MLILSTFAFAEKPASKAPQIHILADKMSVFYFRVDKALLGAVLEVTDSNGTVLISQTITNRKVLVDFFYESAGNYTIKITKDDFQKEFSLAKKEGLPFIQTEVKEEILVVQQ